MIEEVNMPKFGMTMTEGLITNWFKKVGDPVAKDEPLLEVETDKIVNSVDAPASGILEEILFPEGETVKIAAVIARINTDAQPGCAASPAAEAQYEQKPVSETDKAVLERRPYLGLRKTIGEKMSESLRRSPQGTMTARADMTEILQLKKRLEEKGQKVGITDILVKIVSLAIGKNPILNASVEGDEILIYKSIHMGVAMGSDSALFVPVVHHVEEKDLFQIAAELKELGLRVKENRLSSGDISGGTFTLNNAGTFDVDIVTAIINPPEAAILTVGATRREVVAEEDGTISIRPLTTLSLTADHAVMDGIPVFKFLKDLKEIMQNPCNYLDV